MSSIDTQILTQLIQLGKQLEQVEAEMAELRGKKARSSSSIISMAKKAVEPIPTVNPETSTNPDMAQPTKIINFVGENEPNATDVECVPETAYTVRTGRKLTERVKKFHEKNWTRSQGITPVATHESFCTSFAGGYGSGCHIGCDKNQDYTHAVALSNGDILSILCDGHGADTAIDLIRSISDVEWVSIGETDNPMVALEEWIQQSGVDTLETDSGACVIILRANKTGAKYWSVGDCSAFVWKRTTEKNAELIHKSQHHSAEDPAEAARITSKIGCNTTSSRCMKPVARPGIGQSNGQRPHICFEIDKIGTFDFGRVLLQPTRACGQAPAGKPSVTGGPDSIKEWSFEAEQDTEYTIMLYSDGVGDLIDSVDRETLPIEQNAVEVVNKALTEWSGPMMVKGSCGLGGCAINACRKGGDHGLILGGMAPDDISAVMLTIGGIQT